MEDFNGDAHGDPSGNGRGQFGIIPVAIFPLVNGLLGNPREQTGTHRPGDGPPFVPSGYFMGEEGPGAARDQPGTVVQEDLVILGMGFSKRKQDDQ